MSFMEVEMTGKEEWISYDSDTAGGGVIPMDVLSAEERRLFDAGDYSGIVKYTEAIRGDLYDVKVIKGYGVRLSAPGYLDATEWDVFDTKREAEEHADELEAENEDE